MAAGSARTQAQKQFSRRAALDGHIARPSRRHRSMRRGVASPLGLQGLPQPCWASDNLVPLASVLPLECGFSSRQKKHRKRNEITRAGRGGPRAAGASGPNTSRSAAAATCERSAALHCRATWHQVSSGTRPSTCPWADSQTSELIARCHSKHLPNLGNVVTLLNTLPARLTLGLRYQRAAAR